MKGTLKHTNTIFAVVRDLDNSATRGILELVNKNIDLHLKAFHLADNDLTAVHAKSRHFVLQPQAILADCSVELNIAAGSSDGDCLVGAFPTNPALVVSR